MKKLLLFLLMSASALAQVQPANPSVGNLNGNIYANGYTGWTVPMGNAGPFSWTSGTFCTANAGGTTFAAFTVGTPILILDQTNTSFNEVVTVTQVFHTSESCQIGTTTPAFNHTQFALGSASAGLQEAINANISTQVPLTIHLTADYFRAGGTVSYVLTTAKGNTQIGIVDDTTTPTAWYDWNGTNYVFVGGGGGGSGNISGNLIPGRLVLSVGPQTITSSIATDNGVILTYPGNGGIAAQKYTMGTPSSGNYAVLQIGDDNDTTFPALQLFGSGQGQGTTVDVIGVFTPQVDTGSIIAGTLLVSGPTTLGLLQNGVPGQAVQVNQNGGGLTTLQVNGGLGVTGRINLPNGDGTAGQVITSQGAGQPAIWGSGGGSGGSVTSVFGRTGVVVAAGGDYSVGQITGAAPLVSPALTGTPTAPTQACGSSTAIATLAYVAACGGGGGGSPITALGQIISGNTSGAAVAIAGNTASSIAFLSETGDGTRAATPIWQPGNGTGNVVQTVSAQLVTPDVGDATGNSLELHGLFTGLHGAGAALYTPGASSVIGTGGSFSAPMPTTGVSSDSFGGSATFTTGAGISAAGVIFTITLPNMRHNIPSCLVNIVGGTVALGEWATGSNTSNVVTLSVGSNVALANNTPYQANWGPCNGN